MAQEMMAYVDGEFVQQSTAKIGIFNSINIGYGVFDFTRTFNGKLFKFEEHLDRLYASAQAVGLEVGMSREEFTALTLKLLAMNEPLRGPGEEFAIQQRVSQSKTPSDFRASGEATPTVVMCVFKVGFGAFAHFYRKGVHLVAPTVRRTSPQAVDSRIKDTSRMNIILARHEVVAMGDPDGWALLLDHDGHIAEATGANFFLVKDGRLATPKPLNCLAGVSRRFVLDLAAELGIPADERDIAPFDVVTADEAFLTSTSVCCLPASRFNFRPIGNGELPGPITKRLLDRWSEKVGVDIVKQALSHLK